MNNINSIIIEGLGSKIQLHEGAMGNKLGVFTVTSERKLSEEKTEKTTVEVEVYDKLAEACERFLNVKESRVVRVVGRLAHRGEGLRIIGEHIEFQQ